MKRKIAAILAADIAGYSRLVAEDEEEAVRRLSSYRAVFDDFIARFNGRIFNTAGDAVLAEFQSAVDAVRCAVDVQESLRARNLAYPPSRQMNFRIGITIGDVVERDGDLLGDGVNIAARLESIAPPGGICVSRSVYEAVANKLTTTFTSVGQQKLKNMPEPVHAYTVGLDARSVRNGTPSRRTFFLPSGATLSWGAAAGVLVLAAAGAYIYLGGNGDSEPSPEVAEVPKAAGSPSTPATEKDEPGPVERVNNGMVPSPPPVTLEPTTKSAPTPEPAADKAAVDHPTVDQAAPTVTKPADSLTSKVVLQRHWTDCHQGGFDLAISACRALIDGRGVEGNDLAVIQLKYGQALRGKGQVDGAIAAYSESIKLAPSADAYNGRGIAHYDKKAWDEAIADYTEAIRIDPRHGEAVNNRAWTKYKAGQADAALADADKAVRLLPDAAYTWDTRGHIQSKLGNRDAAIRDFRKALALDPSSKAARSALLQLGAEP